MKTNRLVILIAGILLMIGLTSCNYPGAATPATNPMPSPDLTLTAIYSVLAPTATLPPLVQTATAMPAQATTVTPAVTDTPAPTQTPLLPSPTNTPEFTWTPIVPPATRTDTPEPTLPPAPAATATQPVVTPTARVNTAVAAARLETAPVIDGDLSEWRTRNEANHVVFGEELIKSEGDLEARYAVAWDADYLYVAARITDNRYIQGSTGRNLFKGDSIEILLDANLTGDFYDRELSGDDFQLGISSGLGEPGKNMEAYLWYPRGDRGPVSGILMAAAKAEGGYHIEVAIPWSIFDVKPRVGRHYGFAFSVSDNDKTNGQNVQDSLISSVASRKLTNPTTWGDLRLER